MDGAEFDRLTRTVRGGSRRDLARLVIAMAAAMPRIPIRPAGARSQSDGIVVLGGECTAARECRQQDDGMWQEPVVCADNGFSSDGELNCCVNEGCCVSDADCCGDLRCAAGYEVCPGFCTRPPFPTRRAGQICTSHYDCISWPGYFTRCDEHVCTYTDPRSVEINPIPADQPLIPDADAALAVAETLSGIEVSGKFYGLYDALHPDARAILPREAVSGWYEDAFPYTGESAARAVKIRFIAWTWEVTGRTYPETAEVSMRQTLSDGTTLRDEVRLVKDERGAWSWFFGRDRAFVEEQIARYG